MGAPAPDKPTDLAGWLTLLEQRHPRTIDLGLERCGAVYRAMGSPRPAARVVTVAGTNGKGSAVAWSSALLSGLGLRTGAYTSPHLLRFNERLRIDGPDVSDQALVDAFERVEQARGDVSLTYFEFTTLACFDIAHRAGLDVAVLEVGLGGRLDTVNLVDADLVIITPIGLDHMDFLGPDRETIGREKAGVLRPGVPLVLVEPQPPASILERANELGCRVRRAGRDFRLTEAGTSVIFELDNRSLRLPAPLLAGSHQHANLAAALTATSLLEPSALDRADRLAEGMARVRLPGRLQSVPEDPRLLLDVGHNPLAAEVLAKSLAGRDGPVFAVLGMLADKDATAVARSLSGTVDHWYCAGLAGERGRSGEALGACVAGVAGRDAVSCCESVAGALAMARRAAPPAATILVFGSFQTVAEAVTALSGQGPSAQARDSSDPACC